MSAAQTPHDLADQSEDVYALMIQRVESSRLDVAEFRTFIAALHESEKLRDVRDRVRAVEAYARARGESLQNQNDWAEAALWAERRLGVLCAQVTKLSREAGLATSGKRRGKGSPQEEPPITLDDLNITKKQSSRWQKVAAILEPEFEQHIATVRAKGEKLTTAGAIRATSDAADYDSAEWYTPAKYIELAREVLGDIDLDPTSCNKAQETVLAKRFFRKEDDARTKEWRGTVFMNPPYDFPLVMELLQKFVAEYDHGNVSAGIVLVNNATDANWFQCLLKRFPACFTDGRIRFERSDGPRVSPRQGQVFFYAGSNPHLFAEVFSAVGTVVNCVEEG